MGHGSRARRRTPQPSEGAPLSGGEFLPETDPDVPWAAEFKSDILGITSTNGSAAAGQGPKMSPFPPHLPWGLQAMACALSRPGGACGPPSPSRAAGACRCSMTSSSWT